MIGVEELLYEIDFKLNKIATLQHQAIPEEDKLIALNNAQIKFIIDKLDGGNKYQLGFDSFKKRYEDLEVLVESFHDHKLIPEEVDKNIHKWAADVSKLTPKYMFYIDSYLLVTKGVCKKQVMAVN